MPYARLQNNHCLHFRYFYRALLGSSYCIDTIVVTQAWASRCNRLVRRRILWNQNACLLLHDPYFGMTPFEL